MIPKVAFAAIAAAMAVSCAFGYMLRGFIDSERKSDSEWFSDGLSADHDRWEDDPEPTCESVENPAEERLCVTCKCREFSFMREPCLSCGIERKNWEAKA